MSILIQERDEMARSMQALLDVADEEGRDLSEAETKQFDDCKNRIASIDKQLERRKQLEDLDRASLPVPDRNAHARTAREMAAAKQNAEKGKWESFGEFLHAAIKVDAEGFNSGYRDPRLTYFAGTPSGASERNPMDGGWLLNNEFTTNILDLAYSEMNLANMCSSLDIGEGKNGLTTILIDETSRARGSRWGGVRAYWASEADSYTGSKPKFRSDEMKLQKILALMYLTDELFEDVTAMESVANKAVPAEFAYEVDDKVYDGTGAGVPFGILRSGALVSVARESGQLKTFVSANATKMFAALHPRSLSKSVWLMNQEVWGQILQLSLGGTSWPGFIPPGMLKDAPFGALLGRPIKVMEQAKALGTVGDIMLVDPTMYQIIKKKNGLRQDSSIHVRFLYGEQTLRWTLRINGKPIWSSALTPANGTQTLSPYVALETRPSS